MKKHIALLLALSLLFGAVAMTSCSDTTTQPEQTEKSDTGEKIDETEKVALTIYVSTSGSEGGDGTENAPFASIEAARDMIRTLDKANYIGIDVIIKSGTYNRTSSVDFTEEDSGTKDCPIRYIGEDGAILHGGIAFDYTEFEKASGATLELFPEEVRDKLYMYDLGKLGYTADDIAKMLEEDKYYNEIGFIYVDGKQMDLARYPNADEGWIEIEGGYFLDKDGNYTENDGNNGGDDQAVQTIIEYGDEHMDRVLSWKNREDLFVFGRFKFVWCPDETGVIELYEDRDEMLLPFSGGYFPREGGLLYFYNIPEELDAPGEYYVDHNAVLYYYPEEGFEEAVFTYPTFDGDFISLNDVDFITFDGITLESTQGSGIVGNGNNITIKNCTVLNLYGDGIILDGSDITVYGCEIGHVGKHALEVTGGDIPTLTRSNNLICNNNIYAWATRSVIKWGIYVDGCGSTVCHNDVGDSVDLGVCACGPYHTVEYNFIYNTNQFFTDGGALNTHDRGYGTVLRYNVIIGTGYDTEIDIVGVAGIISDGTSGNEIYGNIVYNVTGNALLAAGVDRDTVFHHNLCIKPGREPLEMNCPEYARYYNDDWSSTPSNVEDYLYSEIWQTAFPTLKGIHGNWDPENRDDPMFFYAPVGNKAYDNYLFLDKGYNTYPKPYSYKVGTVAEIESHVENFSGENIETFSEDLGNLTYYNSKRNKNPITISEALAIANEAVGTIMTEEQLREVGRIGVDHGIGDILVN